MDITSIKAANPQAGSLTPADEAFMGNARGTQGANPEKTAEVARQFEAILMRQILSESMKPLLEGGPSGQVYGYLLTDSLADSISKGGGVGLSHVLQTQLKQ